MVGESERKLKEMVPGEVKTEGRLYFVVVVDGEKTWVIFRTCGPIYGPSTQKKLKN